jgi:TetR/AcrR family transcriptional regulator, cholesterol catabolism regulator
MADSSNIARRRAAAREEGNPAYLERLRQLVDAAAVVFKDKGYEATTLNDIADVVGADRASLYYYVGSKEELLREAVGEVTARNTRAAEQIMTTDLTPPEKIRQFISMIILSYGANYPQVFVFIGQDLAKLSLQQNDWARLMTRQVRKLERIIITVLKEGVEDGSFRRDMNVEYVAKGLWGMLNWTHRWYKPGPESSAQEIADTFADLFLGGFTRGKA